MENFAGAVVAAHKAVEDSPLPKLSKMVSESPIGMQIAPHLSKVAESSLGRALGDSPLGQVVAHQDPHIRNTKIAILSVGLAGLLALTVRQLRTKDRGAIHNILHTLWSPFGSVVDSLIALGSPKAQIVFEDSGGKLRDVTFTVRPLGLECNKMPGGIQVKRVKEGSHAEEEGLKVDWMVVSVNGKNVKNLSNDDADALVKSAISKLDKEEETKLRRTNSWANLI